MKKLLLILVFMSTTLFTFSQLPDNWLGDVDIEVFQESINVFQGESSCGVIINSGIQSNCNLESDVEIPLNGGNTFRFSYWGYTSEFVRARAYVVWSDSTMYYSTTYLGPNTSGWDQYNFESQVPVGVTSVKVGIRFYDVYGFSPGEKQYIDDITFESPIGNPLIVNNGDFEQWGITDPEPDNYPTNFSAQSFRLDAQLTWTDAIDGQLPCAYLIKASTEDDIIIPEDGFLISNDFDLTDGIGAANVEYGLENFTFTNLESLTSYYFKIFPYTNCGTSVDYKTNENPPNTQIITPNILITPAITG